MRRVKSICIGAAILALAMTTWSCGEVARQGRSPAQLVIVSLSAAKGFKPTEYVSSLGSDVYTCIKSGSDTRCGVWNDLGKATLSLVLKDQGAPGITSSPSPLNQVTITRYRVVYVRADGHNTPGVDVPFPFEGAATVTVPASGTAEVGFDLVRTQAKLEPPLNQLVGDGGAIAIATIAQVTFYGADQAGNQVSVTGQIGIDFMDFGDPLS